MMNVFDYVNNYINTNTNLQYGDINSSTSDKTEQLLDSVELEAYNQIKEFDRARMIQENAYLAKPNQQIQPTYTVVPGIGAVQQLC